VKTICMIGVGYVGLVTGACLADLGNHVVCLNRSKEKAENLKKGVMPIYEPGLEEVVRRNYKAGRLDFTTNYQEAISEAELVFIAVGTPSGVDGEADLKHVQDAAENVARAMDHPLIIVNKSTVPIGTGDWVANIVEKNKNADVAFSVVSNPEFLREGSAVYDFMNPDRVVLGSLNRQAAEAVAQLYFPLQCPIIITDLRTAEMIKYASNAFLATRISFINEISSICERLGADVKDVARGMGYDKRIGPAFLEAGVGWGGSCFPKDVRALAHMATIHGCHPQLLRAVMEINRDQRVKVLQKLREILGSLDGKEIGILGLSFKPNTDDMREAPSIEIIRLLRNEGVLIKVYDPVAMDVARGILKDITYCRDPYEVAQGSDALVVVTEWNEFKQLNMVRILGFTYRGMGRGYDS